jgi:hypothetical protein
MKTRPLWLCVALAAALGATLALGLNGQFLTRIGWSSQKNKALDPLAPRTDLSRR